MEEKKDNSIKALSVMTHKSMAKQSFKIPFAEPSVCSEASYILIHVLQPFPLFNSHNSGPPQPFQSISGSIGRKVLIWQPTTKTTNGSIYLSFLGQQPKASFHDFIFAVDQLTAVVLKS